MEWKMKKGNHGTAKNLYATIEWVSMFAQFILPIVMCVDRTTRGLQHTPETYRYIYFDLEFICFLFYLP